MLLELAASILLVLRLPSGIAAWQAWSGLALVGVIWLSTLLLQIPRHNTLGAGYDADAHRALVTTNWDTNARLERAGRSCAQYAGREIRISHKIKFSVRLKQYE